MSPLSNKKLFKKRERFAVRNHRTHMCASVCEELKETLNVALHPVCGNSTIELYLNEHFPNTVSSKEKELYGLL